MSARGGRWLAARATAALGAVLPAVGARAAQAAVDGPLSPGRAAQVGLGLVAVLALIGAVAWLVQRTLRLPARAGGRIELLGGLSLGGRERVVLLRVGNREVLLGVSPGRIQTLDVAEPPGADPAAAGPGGAAVAPASRGGFPALLDRFTTAGRSALERTREDGRDG